FGNAGLMVASVTGSTTAGAMRTIEAGRALLPEPVLADADALLEGPDRTASLESARDGDDGPATMTGSTTPVLAPPAPRFPAVAQAALDGVLSTDAVAVITTGMERLS
ncbi:hypothetical protein LGT39_00200, partial [Demequina sp. TTPB684]